MPRRLVLIRHASAQGSHPRGDHERELVERGVADARALGKWLVGAGLRPELCLVSSAVRARQTLDALLEQVDGDVEVQQERRIYDGGVDAVVGAVTELPDGAGTVWLVGHEPVMSTATWELADRDAMPAGLREDLGSGFPTATASVLEVDEVWRAVGFGSARLVAMHTGRAD